VKEEVKSRSDKWGAADARPFVLGSGARKSVNTSAGISEH
jgi:hypothetical protein